jgi:hypothetical protein
MILDHQYPMHEDTKGIPLPELAKVNEINLESVSEVNTSNRFSAAPSWLGHGILLHTNRACLEVVFDKLLGYIEVLFSAEPPCPLLTHVTLALMPLINAIKSLVSRNYNLAVDALFPPSSNCVRHV